MSIKTYTSIAQSYNINNYFDLHDDTFNKIRFSIKDKQLFITAYDPDTGLWSPANVIFDTSPIQTASLMDYNDILNANNIRIQLDANLPLNGSELLIFEEDNNYYNIRRSGLNYAINSSPYLPTANLDDRIVIYRLDADGNPQFTLSHMSTTTLDGLYVKLAGSQNITGAKTFNVNTFLLGGVGGNVTLNGSQTSGSSSYTLEYPTAAPSSALNVLTTSGSSPYSKLTWTDLGTYAALSAFDQLIDLKTTGSPTFANLTVAAAGALNLNYMSTPASSDILATLNTNKQLNNSGVALSSLCTLGTAQTITADKTFNYSAGKIKLSNYSTDNTSTNNFLTLNSSGYVVPCNKLYSDFFSAANSYTFTGAQTFNSNNFKLNGGGSASVTLNAPNISSAYTWTLPSTNPTSGTINVLTTSSTSSPYTLSWSDLSSTYMKLSGTQTNSGVNTWSGNNTFNQDKLLLPTLTTTSSGTYVLTKNASTGAVECATSVAWNNINLINSAQTITAVKTYDYTTAKIALTNTTNDATATNKILTLNTSNQVVPCDKTYSDVFKPKTLDIYDSTGNNYARLSISGGALSVQYYVNGTATGSAYALTTNVLAAPSPVAAWNFNTNLSSTYSTSGTYTFSSGTITANGKYSNCMTSYTAPSTLTSELTPLTRASGYSFTISFWFKLTSWTSGDWATLRMDSVSTLDQNVISFNAGDAYMFTISGPSNSAPDLNTTSIIFTPTIVGNPSSTSGAYSNWSFCSYSWDDSITTLSITYYVNGTKYTKTQLVTNTSHIAIIRSCSRYNSSSPRINFGAGSSSKIAFDDLRVWATALTSAQVDMVYNSGTDVIS